MYGFLMPYRIGRSVLCIRETREEAEAARASIMNRIIERGWRVEERLASFKNATLVRIEVVS